MSKYLLAVTPIIAAMFIGFWAFGGFEHWSEISEGFLSMNTIEYDEISLYHRFGLGVGYLGVTGLGIAVIGALCWAAIRFWDSTYRF